MASGELRVTANGGVRVGVKGSNTLTTAACDVKVDGVEVGVTWASGEQTLAPYKGGAVELVFDVPAGGVLYAYHL